MAAKIHRSVVLLAFAMSSACVSLLRHGTYSPISAKTSAGRGALPRDLQATAGRRLRSPPRLNGSFRRTAG